MSERPGSYFVLSKVLRGAGEENGKEREGKGKYEDACFIRGELCYAMLWFVFIPSFLLR
jgi:hypothetical protein